MEVLMAANVPSGTAKLFMHGRSQAVRLPKEFRFEGSEVHVSKIGNKVILEPIEKPAFDAKAWRAKLDALGARDFLVDGWPNDPPADAEEAVDFG
jgi:antitoxin VapB